MLRYLHGRIVSAQDSVIIVDVGGIGYEVNVPQTSAFIARVGEEAEVFVALMVREDDVSLYGFETPGELRMFRLLQTVSGIGAKAALSILSALSVSEIVTAINREDAGTFTRASGVGKKTAQRIALELKGKPEGIPEFSAYAYGGTVEVKSPATENNPIIRKAVGALMGLGLSAAEAEESAKACYTDGISAEDLILAALRKNR